MARASGTLDFLVSLLIGTVRGRPSVIWASSPSGAVLMSLGAVWRSACWRDAMPISPAGTGSTRSWWA
ncbi:hypothetical protein HBB16_09670 [Pseudonocardia sp. MCCB 268]|nr:hypothetical protein [Pseudonocardia cytotoxica]